MADDRRDERIAELLEVEPLDDVTRRRLVTRALEEAAPAAEPVPRSGTEPAVRSGTEPALRSGTEPARRSGTETRWRLLAAAAALLVVVVVGLVVLTTGGDSPRNDEQALQPRSTADADAPLAAEAAPPSSPSASADASGDATPGPPGVGDLGDLGDLTDAADRRRVARSVRERVRPEGAGGTGTAASRAAPTASEAAACSPTPLDAAAAWGTATFHDRPALVVVTREDDGSARIELVVAEPCEVRELR